MTIGSQLIAALTQAVQALEAGDTDTAMKVLEHASRTCDQAGQAGERLGPEELAQAEDLHEKCTAAATAARRKLAAQLEQAGRGRRAADAYKR